MGTFNIEGHTKFVLVIATFGFIFRWLLIYFFCWVLIKFMKFGGII